MESLPDAGPAPSRVSRTSRMGSVPAGSAVAPPAERRRSRSRSLRNSMRQLLIVTGFTALYLFGLLVFSLQGLLTQATLAATALVSAAVIGVFLLLFASNLNRHASDRNLVAEQILCGLTVLLSVTYAAPATHIMFGPYLLLTLAFGTYRLGARTIFLLLAVALTGFGAVVFAHYLEHQDAALLRSESLHVLLLLLVLPGFLLLAARVRRTNQALFRAGVKIVTIKENARRDPMLGCYNRRYTTVALEQHKRAADDAGSELCLALIDLDHFKCVNDEIGHLGGDEVLRQFARVAQANVRRNDVLGRYGGEEFLLILPDTELLTALNIAERIRAQVERHRWDDRLTRSVTVSIGLTQYVPGESVLDLFSRADTAAYMAKRGGRNQVVVEEPAAQ